jgi:hypothetical protein
MMMVQAEAVKMMEIMNKKSNIHCQILLHHTLVGHRFKCITVPFHYNGISFLSFNVLWENEVYGDESNISNYECVRFYL